MNPRRTTWLTALAGAALLANGCTTSKLWEEGRFASYRQPAATPNLLLFKTLRDQNLLIEYDEACETNDSIRRRAYWTAPNADRICDRRKPLFVSPGHAQNLRFIPMESDDPIATDASDDLYASFSASSQTVTLLLDGKSVGSYQLPVYADSSGRVKQVLLTPITVVADLTIIGGVLGYYLLPALWPSLNCAAR